MKFFLRLTLITGFFSLSMLCGCRNTTTETLPDFSNVVWQSQSHPGLKFIFDGKQRWTGHTGRQRFMGTIELKPCHEVYEVEFGAVMMTIKSNGETAPEDLDFLKMLGKTKYINHQDGVLTFHDKKGKELMRSTPEKTSGKAMR